MLEEDIFDIHSQCHFPLPDEEGYLRQLILQFFGDVDSLSVKQIIAVHEE